MTHGMTKAVQTLTVDWSNTQYCSPMPCQSQTVCHFILLSGVAPGGSLLA
jgi:hypothetical protein